MDTIDVFNFRLPSYRGKCTGLRCAHCAIELSCDNDVAALPLRLRVCGHMFCIGCLQLGFLHQIVGPPKRSGCHCLVPACDAAVWRYAGAGPDRAFWLWADYSKKYRTLFVGVAAHKPRAFGIAAGTSAGDAAATWNCQPWSLTPSPSLSFASSSAQPPPPPPQQQQQQENQRQLDLNGETWPSEYDIFYARSTYDMDIEVYGRPVTPLPWWFPLIQNADYDAQ